MTTTKTLLLRDLSTALTEVNEAIEELYDDGYDVIDFCARHEDDLHGSREDVIVLYAVPAILPRSATPSFADESRPFQLFFSNSMTDAHTLRNDFIREREVDGQRLLREMYYEPKVVKNSRPVHMLLFGPDAARQALEAKALYGSKIVDFGATSITDDGAGEGDNTHAGTGNFVSYLMAGQVRIAAETIMNLNISTSNWAVGIDDNNPTFGTNVATTSDTARLGYFCVFDLHVNGSATATPTAAVVWGAASGTPELPGDDDVIATIDALVKGNDGGGAADTWGGIVLTPFGVKVVDTAADEVFTVMAAGDGEDYHKVLARSKAGIIRKTVPTTGVFSTSLAASSTATAAAAWYVNLGTSDVILEGERVTITADTALDAYPVADPTFSGNDKRYWVALFAYLDAGEPVVVAVNGSEANTASALFPTEAQISAVVGAETPAACLGVFSATRTAGPVYTLANHSTTVPWVLRHRYNYTTVA